uniref:Uncharacterized protein n=1 Tax=Arundo donax TaxID=35708 RepID=A0A0A9CJ34_ARUDO
MHAGLLQLRNISLSCVHGFSSLKIILQIVYIHVCYCSSALYMSSQSYQED